MTTINRSNFLRNMLYVAYVPAAISSRRVNAIAMQCLFVVCTILFLTLFLHAREISQMKCGKIIFDIDTNVNALFEFEMDLSVN